MAGPVPCSCAYPRPVSGTESTAGWRTILVRCAGPAGVLLALLLFVMLPAAGVSCRRSSPFQICYTGRQLITGHPGLDVPDMLPGRPTQTAKLRDFVANTAPLPSRTRVLAVVAVAVLVVGVLSVALRQPRLRAVVVAADAVTGAVLLMAAEITAISGLTDDVRDKTRLFPSYYGEVPRVGDIVETGLGFWLPLAALVVVTAFGAGSLTHAWFAARDTAFEHRGEDEATNTP